MMLSKPTTIKMIVVFDNCEIYYFEIVQFIKDGKTSWVGCKIKPKIWRLSDGLEKEKEGKRLSKGSIWVNFWKKVEKIWTNACIINKKRLYY